MISNAANHLQELANTNPLVPTGRTRKGLFGTKYEYEGPVRRDKSHTIFNIDQWPRGLVWRYTKPKTAA